MKAIELAILRSKITYKPGSMIRIRDNMDGTHTIVVTQQVWNSNKRDEYVHVATTSEPIDDVKMADMTPRELLEIIRKLLVRMETHEVDEWLRLGGVPVNDPHPELNREKKAIERRERPRFLERLKGIRELLEEEAFHGRREATTTRKT